jgi:hypothetical protein
VVVVVALVATELGLDGRAEGLTVVDVAPPEMAVRSVVRWIFQPCLPRPTGFVRPEPTSRASGRRRAGRAQATRGATGGTFRRCWLRFLQAGIQNDSSVHSTRRHSSAFHLDRPCNQEVGVIRKSLTERAIMPRGGILLSAYLGVRMQCAISHTRRFAPRAFGGRRLGGRCCWTLPDAPTCEGAAVRASKYRHVV